MQNFYILNEHLECEKNNADGMESNC